jgi:hypothetical protein
VLGLRGGGLTDFQQVAICGRQDRRDDLMGAQLLTQGRPGGVDLVIEEGLLDGDQQVIGQNTQKDVSLDALWSRWKIGRSLSGLFMSRNASSTRVSRI